MDMYARFKNEIGPFKRFSNQKKMYSAISHELRTIMSTIKTAEQCEARVRTVMKRKKKAIDNNRTSGATRRPVPFEQELEHIRSVDDSVQPQVIWNVEEVWRKLPAEEARENLQPEITPDDGGTSQSDLRRAASSTSRSAASQSANTSAAAISTNGSVASTSNERSAEREQRPRSLQPSRARMAELAQFFKKMDEMNARRDAREQRQEEQRERRHKELVQLNKTAANLLRRLLGEAEVPLDE
ncbi:unnamed protein product [Ixodes persulcatus]